MTRITFCINVISIEQTAGAVLVALWLVLPFRERKNFTRFSLKHITVLQFQNLSVGRVYS